MLDRGPIRIGSGTKVSIPVIPGRLGHGTSFAPSIGTPIGAPADEASQALQQAIYRVTRIVFQQVASPKKTADADFP